MLRNVLCLSFVCVSGTALSSAVAAEFEADVDFDPLPVYLPLQDGINDLRVGLIFLQEQGKIKFRGSGGGITSTVEEDADWSIPVRASLFWQSPLNIMKADYGYGLGFELSTNRLHLDEDESNPDVDVATMQLTVHPTFIIRPLPELLVEVGPFVGIGISDVAWGNHSNNGSYWELGLRGGYYYTFPSRWQVGLELGYLYGLATDKYDENSVSYKYEYIISGFFAGLRLGYRL